MIIIDPKLAILPVEEEFLPLDHFQYLRGNFAKVY